ncbi:putative spermidine/putrescine transport system substrate-binding protein [Planomicrobium stackebrandtii]|uniref:Spermidine/putrescine transport system substrate-binding protein n=1 Tax=Planomicrobium stackebrandtii TaxID=253160 RepID=A0ABU0GQN2_9BACL|nr:ABC transporter substrate-binding protein [Planomicrobium stackebrandtii]MDQ0427284.1 putative spermidine/putrescine transport system substrate-binding protein [Planomicrobium stackebrandtii]
MKKSLLIVPGLLALSLAGCSEESESSAESSDGLLTSDWQEISDAAASQEVNMYMWGGNDNINRYLDEWVAPRLKEDHGVELNRVPMNDSQDIINQLVDEKSVGKTDGSMDIIWINGENFKAAKDNELLWGDFTSQLPNFNDYIDQEAPEIAADFGEPVDGLEAPWGKAQFVFVHDENKSATPPKSMDELAGWVQDNPGQFTYPALPDFTGSAFIRHVLYETTGGYEQYQQPAADIDDLEDRLEPMWQYLNSIEPYLWREGETYPESLAKQDQLYASGEIGMTMSYDPALAASEVLKGRFPESTRTFVLDGGTLSNTHFLSIPFNSSAKAGAMVAINEMMSPEAQIAKLSPENWGDLSALDLEKLSPEQQQAMNDVDLGEATLPLDELENHQLPELSADYIEIIEKGWMEHVAKD